jgi:anthranilate synthase component II
MILMIDNYDSFTYNLVDYCGKLSDEEIKVFRNDKVTCNEIKSLSPTHIIISPGPKTPSEAGISKEVIKTFAGEIPILGVCLGHQAIGEVFGATVIRAKNLMHGKTSMMSYTEHALFKELPNPFEATRYHSLVLDKNTIPDCLEVISHSTDDNEIMALVHKEFQLYGVQFHPESICTKEGLQIIKNFLDV